MLRSRLLRAAFAVALAGSLSFAAPALEPPKPAEKWVSLQVAGLRFISGVSPRETLEIARDLLRMRAAVGKVSGLTGDGAVPVQLADVALGLSLGLGIVKVLEPERLSPKLLGRALAVLIRGLESQEELRAMLADLDAPLQ